jgi:2,4-dienoyl-CoA reductase-like NADH-dependent reductase (Old Yellow Enzyme family)/thioredoxin reductase
MPKITDPIQINSMELPHRMVVAPNGKGYAYNDGTPSERLIANYRYEAEGAIGGLVQMGITWFRLEGSLFGGFLSLRDERMIHEQGRLVHEVHLAGAKCSAQIFHGGAIAVTGIADGPPPVSSEERPCFYEGLESTRPLTDEEAEMMTGEYAKAALRAKDSGYDAVNLHMCHGSLITQFYSRGLNSRDDRWGERRKEWGDNPLLFPLEVLRKTRELVGPDYPIIVRVSGDELLGADEGFTIDDMCDFIAPAFVEAGADCIDVSGGRVLTNSFWCMGPPVYFPHGCMLELAKRLKQAVDVPVIAVGKLMEPKLCRTVIEKGWADLAAVCRSMMADTDFIKKTILGKDKEVRKCLACNMCLAIGEDKGGGLHCAANPTYGREITWLPLVKTEAPKKILVAGAGPAGCEFAINAHQRGHNVTLYEKEDRLGGTVLVGSAIPRVATRDLIHIVQWHRREIERLGIPVVFGTEVTAELVDEEKPDVVVCASGSVEIVPDVPGVDLPHVMTNAQCLARIPDVGQRVAVLGGNEGAETAVSLARYGKQVTIVEEKNEIGKPIYCHDFARQIKLQEFILDEKLECPIDVIINAKLLEITRDLIRLQVGRNEQVLEADTVVLAMGRKPADGLAKALWAKMPGLVHRIGDCRQIKSIGHATEQGAYLARRV